MSFTIDPANKLIIMGTGITTATAQDIYSRWKDWEILSDNAKYPPAFGNSVGGDALGSGIYAGSYFFLRNDTGWRIRPDEADHDLVISGNIYGAAPASPIFTSTVGDYVVSIRLNTSSLTQVVVSGSLTEATQNSVAAIEKILRNRTVTNPSTGVMTIYDDNGVDILYQANIFENVAESQAYRGQGAEVRNRLV